MKHTKFPFLASCVGRELSGEAGPYGKEASPSEPRHERRGPGQAELLPLPAGSQQRVWTQQLSHGQILFAALQSVTTRASTNTDQRAC